METIISNPKEQFLLGAGLDVLHFESREWLDTIDLYKDEIRFFENLLKEKDEATYKKSDYAKMLDNLNMIHTDLFDDLEQSIIEHEQLLSRIELAEKGLSDNNYRQKHQQLRSRINTFSKNFKTFKRIVFEYAKSLN